MNMKDYLDKIFNRDKYYDLDSYIQDKDDDFGYLDHYTIQETEQKSEIQIKNDLRKKKLESL